VQVFFSKRYTYAAIMHKTSPSESGHTIAAANTLQKDVQRMLKDKGSYCDVAASVLVGRVLAEKAKEAQVDAIAFDNTKNLKYEGKVRALIESIRSNGIKVLGMRALRC
jgi:ribosomal protein L18